MNIPNTIFDAAVLNPEAEANSTNCLRDDLQGDRSIFDILRGVNPEKQLVELGNSFQQGGDGLVFNFSKGSDWLGRPANSLEGITVRANGEVTTYNPNDYAQKLFGKDLAELNYSEEPRGKVGDFCRRGRRAFRQPET